MFCNLFSFFFQAEDGIRYYKVTGVQTCALPIYALESRRNAHDLFLRLTTGCVEPLDRLDRPDPDLLLHDPQVVPGTVDPGAPNDVRHLAKARHVHARHVDRGHDGGGRDERAIRIALEHRLEDLPVEHVVPRLFLRDVREYDADRRLGLRGELAGVRVAH